MTKSSDAMVKFDAGAYPVLVGDSGDALLALRENLGGTTIQPFDLDRARIPAGGGSSFELEGLDGAESVATVDGVIVYHGRRRAYWAQSIEESGGGSPPDCSSLDGITGTGTPGGACATCPLNQWGSGKRERGKACQERHLLFMLRPGEFLPLVVNTPPSSLGAVRKYLQRLTSKGVVYYHVVTRLSLDREKNQDGIQYSRISATRADTVPESARSALAAYRESILPALQQVELDPSEFVDPVE